MWSGKDMRDKLPAGHEFPQAAASGLSIKMICNLKEYDLAY
jgi:hypothetical protein